MSNSVSNVERVFGFEDEAFNVYMGAQSHLKFDDLAEVSATMAESEHPLVRYAAGWAAAEMALNREVRNGYQKVTKTVPFFERTQCLDNAVRSWKSAAEDLPAYREAQENIERRDQVHAIELRLLESLAYVPSMENAAAMLAGEHIDHDATEKRQQTRERTAALAEFVVASLKGRTPRPIMVGVVSELACGIAGQCDPAEKYTVLPASFRQDNNKRAPLRADYIAVSGEGLHPKTLIQVKSSHGAARRTWPQMCHVVARRDLTLGGGRRVTDTLTAFVRQTESQSTTSPEAHRLARLGRLLTAKIDQASERPVPAQLPVQLSQT